jgi:hypothetical protein
MLRGFEREVPLRVKSWLSESRAKFQDIKSWLEDLIAEYRTKHQAPDI